MATALEKILAEVSARAAAAAKASAAAKAASALKTRFEAGQYFPTSTPPGPSGAPGGPSVPPPSGIAGPTPTELARQREAIAKAEAAAKAAAEAARKAEEARKREAEAARKAEEERKRQEALRRAREARERLEKIKEMARQKREQIKAKVKAPPFVGPAVKKPVLFGHPVPTILRGLIEKPIPITEPKPTTVTTIEREHGIGISPDHVFGMGAGDAALYKKKIGVDLGEPTVPKEVVTPVIEPTPSISLTPFEKGLIETGQRELAGTLYKKRTDVELWPPAPPKPGEPGFIGPVEPEPPEPLTFEEKLYAYGKLRKTVLDKLDTDERFPGISKTLTTTLFKRTPEEISEVHTEKTITSSLAENDVTQQSISDIAKSYNENLQQITNASADSRWTIGDKTYTQEQAVKYMEENKPTYELKNIKGKGYVYAGKTIDLTDPGAYNEIVNFYVDSQEFVSGVLKDQAVNQSYRDTLKANPGIKEIMDDFKRAGQQDKADEIEYHIRKDIENQFSYTPKEQTSDAVIQALFRQLPKSEQTDYHIKYTYPDEDTNPIDIIGAPGSFKYFKGVTGAKKTEIVDNIFNLYKKGKLPPIMGPGGLGFTRLFEQKVGGMTKEQKKKMERYMHTLSYGPHVGKTSTGQYSATLEGQRLRDEYRKQLRDERIRTAIWNTLTYPEYTEKTYEKMGLPKRLLMHYSDAVLSVFSLPITIPQAVIKLATGKTVGVDIAKGLESVRYGPSGVWSTLSQEAMSKIGVGAPVSEEQRLQIKKRPLEFLVGSVTEAVSMYGLGKGLKLIHAPLTSKIPSVKIPSVTGAVRRGFRYATPRAWGEFRRVFGPKLGYFGQSYKPITMQQISRVGVGKWITPGRGLLGPDLARRGIAYITKTTRPFTDVVTRRVPQTFGRGFREQIVSEVAQPRPTLLGRARMIGARRTMGISRTPAGDIGYRIGKKTIARQPSAVRAALTRGWEQFRYDWQLPTKTTYRAFAKKPIAAGRVGVERAGKTFFRRFTGLERKVGRVAREKVTRAATGERIGVLGKERGTYIETVYERARGTKWISEKQYDDIVEMFTKKGVKKIGKGESIKFGDKYYYMDEAGNIAEMSKAIATSPDVKRIIGAVPETEVLKKAAIVKPVRPSLRTTMKVFKGEVASGRPLAQQMQLPRSLREAGRLGRLTMRELERRPTATLSSRYLSITTHMPTGRPYGMRDIFTTGLRVSKERAGALTGKLRKRAVVKEIVEERIKKYPYTSRPPPMGGQYYISRLRPAVEEVVKKGVKREVSDFYWPTTLGGDIMTGVGYGATRAAPYLAAGLGLGYRREIDKTKLIDTDIERAQRRLPGIIQEQRVRRIAPPITITERLPVTEQLRGMLPWQAQPQMYGMLTFQPTKQEQMQMQLQQQELRMAPVVAPTVEIEVPTEPKYPMWLPEIDELEERRRREMLQRQQKGIGYKEREYEVPDVWGVTKARARIAEPQQTTMFRPETTTIATTGRKQPTTAPRKQTMYRPPTMKQKPRKKQPQKRKQIKKPKTVKGKKIFFDTSTWEMKPQ